MTVRNEFPKMNTIQKSKKWNTDNTDRTNFQGLKNKNPEISESR
jgi:hypothetical protein